MKRNQYMAPFVTLFLLFVFQCLYHHTITCHAQRNPSGNLKLCLSTLEVSPDDPTQCCYEHILNEAAEIVSNGVTLGYEMIPDLLSLCCNGSIPSLHSSCCVYPFLTTHGGGSEGGGNEGYPSLIDMCCGDANAFATHRDACCHGHPHLDHQTCCTEVAGYTLEQVEECCGVDEYDPIREQECCTQPTFTPRLGGTLPSPPVIASQLQHCCNTSSRIEQFPGCCTVDVFPSSQTTEFHSVCCRSMSDYTTCRGCCTGDAPYTQSQYDGCCSTVVGMENHLEQCCGNPNGDITSDPTTMEVCCDHHFAQFHSICCDEEHIGTTSDLCCDHTTTLDTYFAQCCPQGVSHQPSYCGASRIQCSEHFLPHVCCSDEHIHHHEELCCQQPSMGADEDAHTESMIPPYYMLPSQITACCTTSSDALEMYMDHCCSPHLPQPLAEMTVGVCCDEQNGDTFSRNIEFCCVVFYSTNENQCNEVVPSYCTAWATHDTSHGSLPDHEHDDAAIVSVCCDNPHIPFINTPWELNCIHHRCGSTFTPEECCSEALHPSIQPWAVQCQEWERGKQQPSPPPPTPSPSLPPPPRHDNHTNVINLQHINITDISSQGSTRIGILNTPIHRRHNHQHHASGILSHEL